MNEILYEEAEGVARITLNRPESGNAFNQPMADALLEVALKVGHDPDIRVVTLTGAGRMFCVGGDVGDFAKNSDKIGVFLAHLAGTLHQSLAQFSMMKKPLITLVNGPAAGAGMSVAIGGDFVLAAPEASFTAAYCAIGLTPDGGMTWTLPRLIGLRQAQDIILSNRRVGAEEAVGLGMATRMVSGDLAAAGAELAATLKDRAIQTMGQARWLLNTGMTESYVAQMDRELQSIVAAGESAEGREGVSAFLARREPDFKGAN
ncbi:enoyl-CoA hydratase/isomerase family protein [Paracoccus aerodenitrificans]|nr:enoyl-CoA hydratase/isomerase family protein [Paracoccus aerodenitrificans]